MTHKKYINNTVDTSTYENKSIGQYPSLNVDRSQTSYAQRKFAGYASVFNVVDNTNDVILKNAFQSSIKKTKKIKLLWQHDASKPIGAIEKLFEDSYGLYVEGEIFLNIAQGKEAHFLIQSGAVQHMSIGYQVLDSYCDAGIRYIKQIKLFEISFVTFAANSEAQILDLKQIEKNTLRLEEAVLSLLCAYNK